MGMLDNRLSFSESDTKKNENNIPADLKKEEDIENIKRPKKTRNKNRKEEIPKKNIQDIIDSDHQATMSQKDAEDMAVLEALMDDEIDKKNQKKKKIINKISIFSLLALCCYMIFLIYGVFITNFSYDQKGEIEAVKMSVKDISEKNNFMVVENLYMNMRNLYEDILTLDYRITQEDPINVATDYSSKADECMKMATVINGTEITSDYRQIVTLISQNVEYIMWNYCTYMSQAITANDSSLEQQALSARQEIENYFNQITENMITLSESIKGYDNTDLASWDADKFVDENLRGIKN